MSPDKHGVAELVERLRVLETSNVALLHAVERTLNGAEILTWCEEAKDLVCSACGAQHEYHYEDCPYAALLMASKQAPEYWRKVAQYLQSQRDIYHSQHRALVRLTRVAYHMPDDPKLFPAWHSARLEALNLVEPGLLEMIKSHQPEWRHNKP